MSTSPAHPASSAPKDSSKDFPKDASQGSRQGSPQPSRQDSRRRSRRSPTLPRRRRWTAADLSLIAVFAALIAAFSLLPGVPLGAGVPITLQTLAVLLTGVLLGPSRGTAAVGLYLLAGLAGLPVFSGFRAGLGVLAGPSAGYLLAFLPAAFTVGLLARAMLRHTTSGRRRRARFLLLFGAATAASFLVVHPLGIAGMMLNARLEFRAALAADMVFWPGDLLKNLLAAGVAVSVLKAFPRLAAGRR